MKSLSKRIISVFLSLIMLFSVFSAVLPIVASALVSTSEHRPVYIVVPETVYLTPSTGASTTAQYFVNNTFDSSTNTITLDAAATATAGKFYFKCEDAKQLSMKTYDWNGTEISGFKFTNATLTNGYWYVAAGTQYYVLNTGLTAGQENWVRYEFTVTMNDNSTEVFNAYSTVYSPYYTPVATAIRVRTTSGGHPNIETISWISGIHSVSSSYSYTIQGNTGSLENEFSVLTKARLNWLTPMLSGGLYTGGAGSREYTAFGASGQACCDANSVVYVNTEAGDNYRCAAAMSPTGIVTVDKSRNTNLQTVPNLTIGLLVAYSNKDSGTPQYGIQFADITDLTVNSGYTGFFCADAWWGGKYTDPVFDSKFSDGNHTTIGGISVSNDTSGSPVDSGYSKVWYNDTWNREIVNDAGTSKVYKTYSYISQYADSGHAYTNNTQHLQVNAVDKSALRSAVQSAINAGYQQAWFSSSTDYDSYKNAIQSAAHILGNPMSSQTDIDGAVTAVNDAKTTAASKISNQTAQAVHYGSVYTLDGNGNITGTNVINALAENSDSLTDKSDKRLTYSSNTYDGYTYLGCSGTDAGTGNAVPSGLSSSTTSVSFIRFFGAPKNYYFYYRAPDVTVTVNPSGGTWNGKTENSQVTASVGSTFTPNAPQRDGFTFAGWSLTGGGILSGSILTCGSSEATLTATWTINSTALTDDTAVLDFYNKASVSVHDNDTVKDTQNIQYGISLNPDVSSLDPGLNISLKYGTPAYSNGIVTYTPNRIVNGAENTLYFVAIYTDPVSKKVSVASSKINLFPQTAVYYEDDSFVDTDVNSGNIYYTGNWETVTDAQAKTLEAITVSADVYGYSEDYAKEVSIYSGGSAHKVTVKKGEEKPMVSFDFAGTGFDVISLISDKTGTVEVKVLKMNDEMGSGLDEYTVVYDWIVDTYYTYKPETDESTPTTWTPDTGNADALYQIPVIGRIDLPYGTYTVQIIPTYSTRLDHAKRGEYDFYLDAVRIYNPCGDDTTAAAAYAADNEQILLHKSVRDMLVSVSDLNSTTDENTVVFINSKANAGNDNYSVTGPKNEVYLSKGQSVAFAVQADSIPASVQISAHSANCKPASMRVGYGTGSYTDTIDISSATTLYYKVTSDGTKWTQTSDGKYTATIVIDNNSADATSILSVCNLKITTGAGSSANTVLLSMSDEALTNAVAVATTMAYLSADDSGLFVPEEVTAEAVTEEVIKGDTVKITVKTTSDVARLTINGEDAECTSSENGEKTWVFEYEATTAGEQTLEMTAYDSDGYASETTEITVDVESQVEYIFNKLVKFISAIIELFKKITSVLA